jgi:hypothetical protein
VKSRPQTLPKGANSLGYFVTSDKGGSRAFAEACFKVGGRDGSSLAKLSPKLP